MEQINQYAQQLEGLPGYDMVVDWVNDKAGEKYSTKDPFYVEIHGKKKRRKAPETCTKQEQKSWKRVKKRAWLDDMNFFGCYPINLGLGLAPLLALLPVIGPLMMFAIHGRLVSIADQEFHLPPDVVTKMHANILFDLLISFPPILGSLFSWLNGCSTRNAALVHTYLVKRERKKEQKRLQQLNIHTGAENLTGSHSFRSPAQASVHQSDPRPPPPVSQRSIEQNGTLDQYAPTNQVPLQKTPARKPPTGSQAQSYTSQGLEHHY